MKKALQLVALLMAGWSSTQGATNTAVSNRILLIDSSSMPVGAGKATLIIGALELTNGIYSGDYKIKVTPYFFKSEKGRLAIMVSDESMARIAQGKAAAVIGTATTNGKGGKSRHIDATATPVDINHGTLKLWFAAGKREMTFEPAYHFAGEKAAGLEAQTTNKTFIAKVP
jgi:hypothetical protein